MRSLFFPVALLSLLGGCASHTPAPVATPFPLLSQQDGLAEPASAPVATAPVTIAPPSIPPSVVPPKKATLPPAQLLDKLLPDYVKPRSGWRDDIVNAIGALQLPPTAENFCAVIAVIEQESTFQADPVVPGLPAIVWNKIEEKVAGYHIPLPLVKAALLKPSPTGESYKSRIDSLRTERQMNDLFEDMAAEAGKLGLPVGMKNPIRTAGTMQVSVDFAQGHIRAWPYPYRYQGSLRDEVFSRRGGIYFGTANLLHYPAGYRDMVYRFADFNAGRYSSRNAAFQLAVAELSGRKLAPDGDLLRYRDGLPSGEASSTERALYQMSQRLGLSNSAILRDLKQEKNSSFSQSVLYQKVMALADQQLGRKVAREAFPQIRLNSPKITRKLTTEWFAKRVGWRYDNCLKRSPL
ncbi:DUF1615 domain-containing protein [Vogesella indigofera]|uniref:DUF1615 domain-containing protein n=1 Tax=Vogesella indigofera TaxID=45465 RepID=UPI00234F1817|nr:DUF1615 domain-containing protein [Vogesella indigofera]MDC7710026.1 DUF1615 domain-containing protein [Vogesella indigofera]